MQVKLIGAADEEAEAERRWPLATRYSIRAAVPAGGSPRPLRDPAGAGSGEDEEG
ncbi:hypothetical protein WJ438_32050 [Streptomyces sp. GD-15H]|uniref:hypothetical protein n=1 Tax=Streptomyces sp. GD-15H TaxID=3129112 RepID=UPI003246CD2A